MGDAMSQITRIYASHQAASDAVKELELYRFSSAYIHVVSPPPVHDSEYESDHPPPPDIAAEIVRAGISAADAAIYAEEVRRGATLVTVNAPFGEGALATRILDDFGPAESAVREADLGAPGIDDAAPFSKLLGLPLLWQNPAPFSALLGLPVFTKTRASLSEKLGIAEISADPAPLSNAVKLPVLSDKPAPFSGLFGLRTLTSEAAPFSALFKWRTVSAEPDPLSSRLGWSTISQEPAPFSKLLGLPVLLKKE
jgi:hypothetical protein